MHDETTTLTRQEIGFQHSFQYQWQFRQPKSNIFVYLVCACMYVLTLEFELFLFVVCAFVYICKRAQL